MASKFSKRGKNPGAVDSWLDSLGYYRKNVAYDETCLFRAIAEQLFYSQLYHERVRKECISYGKKHSKEFKHQVPKKRDWYDRLKKLSVHMLVCTDTEIQLISRTYDVDITVFHAADRTIQEFKCHPLYEGYHSLLLCKMSEDHYDTVYNKEYIADAGFCQSIVYQLLYEEVFDIPDVTSIVNSMLHDKQASYSLYFSEAAALKTEFSDNDEMETNDDFLLDSSIFVQNNVLAPFPFKVAKALDPNMYRNIEYDTWLEVRRAALRLGDWYYGDDKLILGTRCIVNFDDENLLCYIQEILKDEDKCVVYITKLAQRCTVRYSDLRPEDNAKPWPLPYRFARNLPVHSPNDASAADGDRKSLRKRREKKRQNSLSTNSPQSDSRDINENIADLNINNYEGCPLHMQDANETGLIEKSSVKPKVPQDCKYSAEAVEEWNISSATGSESLSMPWLPTPINSQECSPFDNKGITPPTSSVGYRDSNNGPPLYYNCGHEYAYSSVPMWSQPHYIVSPDPGISLSDNDNSSPIDSGRNSQNYVYYQTESAYGSPTFLSPSLGSPPSTFAPFTYPFNDRYVCSTPVTPVSPHVDVYPLVYPVPAPGTPMLYSHPPPPTPAPRPLEFMTPVASPMPMYNPPNDLQCVNSPTYLYPPHTPPVAWYPPSVNSQGFIFPPPLNPPNVPTHM